MFVYLFIYSFIHSSTELFIEGSQVPRRKSLKEKRVSFSEKQEEVRNRINSLAPVGGVTERPQSRGGMAFDVMLCPETGNIKRRPQHLKTLERRKKKSSRRTKEEIEEKLKNADERRKVIEQHLALCPKLIEEILKNIIISLKHFSFNFKSRHKC